MEDFIICMGMHVALFFTFLLHHSFGPPLSGLLLFSCCNCAFCVLPNHNDKSETIVLILQ